MYVYVCSRAKTQYKAGIANVLKNQVCMYACGYYVCMHVCSRHAVEETAKMVKTSFKQYMSVSK